MSNAALRVLLVTGEGTALPALAPASAFGPFDLHISSDLDAATARLATDHFDAIVIGVKTVDARRLLQWPALSQATAEPALIVLTTDEPGAELATQLVRRGVQDVLPLSIDAVDALPRALRLAIERKDQERMTRKAYATDLMTGLPNQSQLVEHVNQLIALREREPAPMALLALRVEGLASAEARFGRSPPTCFAARSPFGFVWAFGRVTWSRRSAPMPSPCCCRSSRSRRMRRSWRPSSPRHCIRRSRCQAAKRRSRWPVAWRTIRRMGRMR